MHVLISVIYVPPMDYAPGGVGRSRDLGSLLLTWFNFNPSMDK